MPATNPKTVVLLQFRAADALKELETEDALDVIIQWLEERGALQELFTQITQGE